MSALQRARILSSMLNLPAAVLLSLDTPGGSLDGLDAELWEAYAHVGERGLSTWAHRETDPGAM